MGRHGSVSKWKVVGFVSGLHPSIQSESSTLPGVLSISQCTKQFPPSEELQPSDRMTLKCLEDPQLEMSGGNSETYEGWRFWYHSPNFPGCTLWKASRAGEVIGAFFKAQTSTWHFSWYPAKAGYPPPAALCRALSKVSTAEAAPLEVHSWPSSQGLWPLHYWLVGSLMIAVI